MTPYRWVSPFYLMLPRSNHAFQPDGRYNRHTSQISASYFKAGGVIHVMMLTSSGRS